MAKSVIKIPKRSRQQINTSTDLNDCTEDNVVYWVESANVPINAPDSTAYNALVWNITGRRYTVQFYASSNKSKIYFRFNTGGIWQAWITLQTA